MQVTQDDIVVLAVTVARHTVTIEQLVRENQMLREKLMELQKVQVQDEDRLRVPPIGPSTPPVS